MYAWVLVMMYGAIHLVQGEGVNPNALCLHVGSNTNNVCTHRKLGEAYNYYY